jgi:hypothetical protein
MIRRSFRALGVFMALAASAPALADPVGTYDVAGINPDNGGEYSGTVTVTRNGETYSVVWIIADAKSTGVGLGGKRGASASTGAASPGDDMITIGYGNESGFGISQYDLQPDGSWKGHWAYAGGETVSTETWTRQGAARSLDRPETPASSAMKPMSSTVARP